MNIPQREVTFYTPNKTYSGSVDIKNDDIRTSDLLNSASLYWKNPGEKRFEDAILLNGARVTVGVGRAIGTFSSLQMRLSEIIFFTDGRQRLGNELERNRARKLSDKSADGSIRVKIVTRMCGNSFYVITGTICGLFKSKSQLRYLPISRAQVSTVTEVNQTWTSRKIIDNLFIGLSTKYIEACAFATADGTAVLGEG